MVARKLNVLVYTGTGASPSAASHAIATLRSILTPNYAVIPIKETTLLTEPWQGTCALLVFPGGADLGYQRVLGSDAIASTGRPGASGNWLTSQYVAKGGAYLGLCAGGYYGSARCEFEVGRKGMEVVGNRELAFFPGTCRGGAIEGFEYGSELGSAAAGLIVNQDAFESTQAPDHKLPLTEQFRCYVNGGGVFVDAESMHDKGVEVLANYRSKPAVDGGQAAVVYCRSGKGAAILMGPHPEFSASVLAPRPDIAGYDDLVKALATDDAARDGFLRACLVKLGLEVNQRVEPVTSFSKLHLSSRLKGGAEAIVTALSPLVTIDGNRPVSLTVKAEQDVFHFQSYPKSSASDIPDIATLKVTETTPACSPADPMNGEDGAKRQIIVHHAGWPMARTARFNHGLYHNTLAEAHLDDDDGSSSHWGDVLLYGEAVTSTNTLLERNPGLTSNLPTGFTFAATTQIAARGRGANVWVSPPAGQLIMSTVIRHNAKYTTTRPAIFISYLAAVAVVEAIHSYDDDPRYAVLPVKLKWPNDIYARDPTKPEDEAPEYVKIGGLLANMIYDASTASYLIIMGIGLNTNNNRPTTSLDAMLHVLNRDYPDLPPLPDFRIEKLIARITVIFEHLYNKFLKDGFVDSGIADAYYKHWLHTGQVVQLQEQGNVKVRVLGVTDDWGMLKVAELGNGKIWTLQSDENSFDFWKGLVKRKV